MKPIRSLPRSCLRPLIACCGVILGIQSAQSAVVFYQPPTRLRLHNFNAAHHDYNIDLDGDGNFDLQHDAIGGAAFLRTWSETRILGLRLPYPHLSYNESQPYVLTSGDEIGPDSPSLYPQYGQLSGWWDHPMSAPGVGGLHVRYDSGTSGFFVGTRGYIGVEFLIEEQVHYGWIELSNLTWWQSEIHGWAYESEPGKSIIAGAIPEPGAAILVALASCALGFHRGRNRPASIPS